jgi:RimJ/RimL family protein N-acetyltransferase
MCPETAVLVTERLILRPLREADLPALVAYRSDPEVARFQTWDTDWSADDARRLLASQRGVELGQPGVWVQLAAVDRVDGTLYGDCAARVVPEQRATAEIGITFGRAGQGRGLASEALAALVGALFEEHDLHRVFAETDDRNPAVHRLLERLGFRCEGRHVDADWCKGEWVTLRMFALLETEWRRCRA